MLCHALTCSGCPCLVCALQHARSNHLGWCWRQQDGSLTPPRAEVNRGYCRDIRRWRRKAQRTVVMVVNNVRNALRVLLCPAWRFLAHNSSTSGRGGGIQQSAPRVYYGDKTSHDDEPHVVAHAECSQNHQSLTQLSISWRVVLTYVLPSATQHLNLQSCARGMVCCRPWQARQTSA